MHEPKPIYGIMVSSTFSDLKTHRQKVIDAITRFHWHPNVMENDSAKAGVDVIDSSLNMVRDSAAYVGVISLKYGQTPFDKDRNPNRLSLTELEFDEAMQLKRPILLFVMGDKHTGTRSDFEQDPENIKKLDAFRERAKKMRSDGEVERVYCIFNTLEEFEREVTVAVGNLVQSLASPSPPPTPPIKDELPKPPELCALPRYAGSHDFVGRRAQLDTLDDWCAEPDPNPVLLFQAIGGTGKSMLTWEWLNNHASRARADWAGRFWYSFYERGATMGEFCLKAVAYMTAMPAEEVRKRPQSEIVAMLIDELSRRPWLLVLDGLERVLVAYNRPNAAQLSDDEADTTTDIVAERDPCAAIKPDDDDLLRELAVVAPSKILVTSRLMPRVLINASKIPIPGVRYELLPGLRPTDAEELIRACGVTGDSKTIQTYLQTNCDCHPLVVGSLAGLINDYLPARGDFDRWSADPNAGGALDFAGLDLTRRRNHILAAALDALSPEARQLLQTLSLLHSGADYAVLEALNPHRALPDALKKLQDTVRDLEKRGLLQYDWGDNRYDLHPVVRGVVAARLSAEDTERLGRPVVDHFSSRPHDPWEHARCLDDVTDGLEVVHTLLHMKRYDEAFDLLGGELFLPLYLNLNEKRRLQSLLRAFFPNGWMQSPAVAEANKRVLFNFSGIAVRDLDAKLSENLRERGLFIDIREENVDRCCVELRNIGIHSFTYNHIAQAERLSLLSLRLAEADGSAENVFIGRYFMYTMRVTLGQHNLSDTILNQIEKSDPPLNRHRYLPGEFKFWRCVDLLHRSQLTEGDLSDATTEAKNGMNRQTTIFLQALRGDWYLSRDDFPKAANSYDAALRMVHETGDDNLELEAELALAQLKAGTMDGSAIRARAEILSRSLNNSWALAKIWQYLGERDNATTQALGYHTYAVADGEPFVQRFALDRARTLLGELGVELPPVPQHDPSKDTIYPWEAEVEKLIEKIKAKKTS